MKENQELTDIIDPAISDYEASEVAKDNANWIGEMTHTEFKKFKALGVKELVSYRKLPKSRADGTTYEVYVRYKEVKKTLKFTSKEKAFEFRKEITEKILYFRAIAPRGKVSAKIKGESKRPYLATPLWEWIIRYDLHLAETKALRPRCVGFRKFVNCLKDSELNKLTLEEFFSASEINEILKKTYKSAKKITKGEKLSGYFRFVESDLLSRFSEFIEKRLRDKLESDYREAVKDPSSDENQDKISLHTTFSESGLYPDNYAKLVKKFVKENRPNKTKRLQNTYEDPSAYIKAIIEHIKYKENKPAQIGICLSLLLGCQLGLRSNELLALRPENFFIDEENGTGEVRAENTIKQTGNGDYYAFGKTKTDVPYTRPLNRDLITTYKLLMHPLFSYDLRERRRIIFISNPSRGCRNLKFEKDRITGEPGFSVRVPDGLQLGEWLLSGGLETVSKKFKELGIKPKRTLVIERTQVTSIKVPYLTRSSVKEAGPFFTLVSYRYCHRAIVEAMGLKWVSNHERFRAFLCTKLLIEYGNTLEAIQKVQEFFGWKSAEMVNVYSRRISENKIMDAFKGESFLSDIGGHLTGEKHVEEDVLTKESILKKLSSGVSYSDLNEEERSMLG